MGPRVREDDGVVGGIGGWVIAGALHYLVIPAKAGTHFDVGALIGEQDA